jgi:signal-transduction protein with cAMP-binding, CBS, and nucleotidyltransferase domain
MHVAKILELKGRAVETIGTQASVLDVARRLCDKRIGAIVVLDAHREIAGIVSERDLIRALVSHTSAALELTVGDVMTADVITCREADTIDELMHLMTTRRIRHLPVVEGGQLVGIVSIGDVVKHHTAEVEFEATAMRDYIAHA